MFHLSNSLLVALAASTVPALPTVHPEVAKLKVVATIPDLADIVREIGGDRVEITTITRGTENLHAVTARPSHLAAMSRADVFVQVGLSLETSFVPGLLEGARNKAILPGNPGFVNVSEGWEAIEVPESLSRQAGDVHPHGNPHMNLDPRAGEHMARVVCEGLTRLDPGSEKLFQENLEAYRAELEAAKKRWDELAKGFRGKSIVVYHTEYAYFARYYDMETDAIEVRPGIPPTPNHLAEVISAMKTKRVKVVLIAPWSNNRSVRRVAEATGAKIVEVPNQVGTKGAETWIAMLDLLHHRLAEQFAGN